MEKVEKVLLLAVLGVAVMIIAVMSFIPESDDAAKPGSSEGVAQGPVSPAGETKGDATKGGDQQSNAELASAKAASDASEAGKTKISDILGDDFAAKPLPDQKQPAQASPKGGTGEPLVFGPDEEELAAKNAAAKEAESTGPTEPERTDDPAQTPVGVGSATFAFRDLTEDPRNPAYAIYRVRAGDTLSEIAARFCNHDQRAIEAVNEGLDANSITEGQQLWIPRDIIKIREPGQSSPVARREAPGRAPGQTPTAAESKPEPSAQPSGGALASHAGAGPKSTPKSTPNSMPKPAPSSSPKSSGPPSSSADYRIVKHGDTLWGIAADVVGKKRATQHVLKLRQWNPRLRNSDVIKEGEKLRVR